MRRGRREGRRRGWGRGGKGRQGEGGGLVLGANLVSEFKRLLTRKL